MNNSDLSTQIEQAFHDGTVASLPPATWDNFLAFLCAHSPSRVSGVFDPREVNRGLLLNTLKNFHFVNQIERSNKRFAGITIIISLLAIAGSSYSIWSSESQSKNIASIAAAQEKQVASLASAAAAQEKQVTSLASIAADQKRQIKLLTDMLAESRKLPPPNSVPMNGRAHK